MRRAFLPAVAAAYRGSVRGAATQEAYFAERKQRILADLAGNANDRSIAGGVDAGVRPIVDAVNATAALVTTSSCSGRVSLFHRAPKARGTEAGTEAERRKRGAQGLGFLFTSHDPVADPTATADDLHALCAAALECDGERRPGVVELKFEPVILHALCRDVAAADALLLAAGDAGLRRSGMWSRAVRLDGQDGGRALTVEVGASFGFNSIVAAEGELLVTGAPALAALLRHGNAQFAENDRRKGVFLDAIRRRCGAAPTD